MQTTQHSQNTPEDLLDAPPSREVSWTYQHVDGRTTTVQAQTGYFARRRAALALLADPADLLLQGHA